MNVPGERPGGYGPTRRSRRLKIDEIITRRYSLEQVNEGYRDLLDGKNLRGVIIHER